MVHSKIGGTFTERRNMEKIDIKSIKIEQSIFTDTWLFYKKYCHCQTEADFDRLIAESDELSKKYKETEFNSLFLQMQLAVMDQIEKNYKKSKEKGEK